MLVFTGALVLLRELYCVINAITAVKAHRQWQRTVCVVRRQYTWTAKVLQTFEVSVWNVGRGEGLIWAPTPDSGIYVPYLTLCQTFLISIHLGRIPTLWALFSYIYCRVRSHWIFLINFWNRHIVSAVTHTGPTSCYSPRILTFYSYLSSVDLDSNCRVWCGRPGWTLWCHKNRSRQFICIFKYFMKRWRLKKTRVSVCCAAGVFFRLYWLWLEYISQWMNFRNATLLTVWVCDIFQSL